MLSTTDGENLVVAGLDLAERGGNVVIDDLHFSASRYLYTALESAGHVELRVVRHRNWKIDIADMEQAIDRNTRLVSMALVSNINGYMHDARAVSEIAHAHGAYVYADIIQAAGNTPDRRAGDGNRLLRLQHLQVADGGLRPRLPVRAGRSAGRRDQADPVRPAAGHAAGWAVRAAAGCRDVRGDDDDAVLAGGVRAPGAQVP